MVVSKFDHHLPLYRQSELMAAQGIGVDRSTLAGWTGQAALLDPIVSRIREQGLKAAKIHADDTPCRCSTPAGAGPQDDRASGATTPPLIWCKFTSDRSGTHPQRELAGFTGFLQADAYAGYDKLYQGERVTEVACWAHFRRKTFDIHQDKPTALTNDLRARIGTFYAVEAGIRGQPPDARARVRQEQSRPLVDALRVALDDALRRLSPKSEMGQGLPLRHQALAGARAVPRRRAARDRQQHRRTCPARHRGRPPQLAVRRLRRRRRARGRDLHRHRDRQGQRRRSPGLCRDVLARIAGGWPAARWDELMPWNWRAEPARLAA